MCVYITRLCSLLTSNICLNIWKFAKQLQATKKELLSLLTNVQLQSAFKNLAEDTLLTYSSTVILIYFLQADSFSNNSWMLSAKSSYQTRRSWSPGLCLIRVRLDIWGFHRSEMWCCVSHSLWACWVSYSLLLQLKGVEGLLFPFLLPLLCGWSRVHVWVVYASQRY